ncbi:hypothetical protein AB6A40_009290 [Gnathostoma spinigerum]|uniref:Uncharacterized protein n=1 Tax=Gnathostoma spinigerum TaxID=75299 RepID=A0ABD6ERW6_9BILA
MGGWKLEASRFFILVAFPVASFWLFNQPNVFKTIMKNWKVPQSEEGDAAIKLFKETLNERRRKKEYENFLLQQMEFEEAKKYREEHNI